jgi:hypothetical protein
MTPTKALKVTICQQQAAYILASVFTLHPFILSMLDIIKGGVVGTGIRSLVVLG